MVIKNFNGTKCVNNLASNSIFIIHKCLELSAAAASQAHSYVRFADLKLCQKK